MTPSPPDWQLPPGITRGLWDYLHDPEIARCYDAGLTGSTLGIADQRFAERHFDRPGRLIDLGCGTGRLLVPFAQRGYWVLGVDLSEAMLKQSGERARRAGVSIHRAKANLVDLGGLRDQSFDYAACLFSTLGMVDGASNRQRVLHHVFRLLRPGGKFILHVHNRWFNVWNAEGRRWLARDLFPSSSRSKERGDKGMPVHQGIAGLKLHLFTRPETKLLLRGAGLEVMEIMPVGLTRDGHLRHPWFVSGLRAYGYLFATTRRR